MPDAPNTNTPGRVLRSVGDGTPGARWATLVVPGESTYSVSGNLVVPSGATGYLPPFFVHVPAGQSRFLVGVMGMIRGGTSVTGTFYHGLAGTALPGTAIGGLAGLVYSTTVPTSSTAPTVPEQVFDGDYLHFVPTAVSASPDGLSCSFFWETNP